MRNIFLLGAVTIFLFSCTEKKAKGVKNDLSIYKLKGRVKSLDQFYYIPKDSSGQLPSGNSPFLRHWVFDRKGNFIEKETKKNDTIVFASFYKYDSNEHCLRDSDVELKDTYWSIYKYDSKGNQIERGAYGLPNHIGKPGILEIYKVDDKGHKIEEDSYWGNKDSLNYKAYLKYNDNGQETEKDNFDGNSKLHSKVIRTYDKNGNQTEFLISDRHDSIENKFTYKYDSANNETEDCSYKKDGTIAHKALYKYDARGNYIEITTINPDGSSGSKTSYRYDSFDKEGNWIKRVSLISGKANEIEERTITYY